MLLDTVSIETHWADDDPALAPIAGDMQRAGILA